MVVPSSQVLSRSPRARPGRFLSRTVIATLAAHAGATLATDFRAAHLEFDGVNDVAVVASRPGIAPDAALTVEAWVRPASLSGTKEQDRVVAKSGSYELTVSTGDTGCGFGTSGDVQWRATIGGVDARICGGALTLGAWAHVAGTYASGTFSLYVDGARVASVSRSGTLAVNTSALTIGNRTQLDRAFDGAIDAVRIWGRALTQAELQANMNAELGGTGQNLAAEYRFAEGAGQTISDATTNDHDGVRGLTADGESSDPAWGSGSGNTAPSVDAGADRTLTLPANTVFLDGTVSDDGLPASTLTVQWSQLSGPGSASFADPTNEDTEVSFPAAGQYVLQLAASDGELSAADSVRVEVRPASGELASIEVLPETVTLNASQSQQFTATGRDAAGNPVAITPSWTASGGTISANGLYTAPAQAGTHTVRASVGNISDTASVTVSATTIYPGASWLTATPAEVGMNAALLDQARNYALTGGGSGFIARYGKRIYTWGSLTTRYELKSATKSIGSAVLGIALRDGRVRIEDAAQLHLPSFGTPPSSNASTGWLDDVTLLQLANMTSGFEKTGGNGVLAHQPGTMWRYSDGATNWLADVLTQVYGQDLYTLFTNRVMTPIGIPQSRMRWRSNVYRSDTLNGVKRREFGSGVTADVDVMARFGYLFLRRGLWAGQRILDESFIDFVRRPTAQARGLPVHDPTNWQGSSSQYGVLWWTNDDGHLTDVPRDTYWAWGMGDALIVVIPSLDLVITRLGSAWYMGPDPEPDVLSPFLGPIARSTR